MTPPTIPAWSLAWMSPEMPAPAFWYYHTEAEARRAAERLPPAYTTTIREVHVPVAFTGWSA